MSMSRLSTFQAYDYYNTIASKRNLTLEEQEFYTFCCENHEEICSENTDDNSEIINTATELYMRI